MDTGKIKFFLGEVTRSFTRNAGMQVTAIGTVAVTIVLLGAFLFTGSVASHMSGDALSQITISVYMLPAATAQQEDAVRSALANDARVLDAAFVPKKQGLAEMRERMKGEIDTSLMTENPLPDKFRVHARKASDVPAIAAAIQKMPGVQLADYGKDIVQQLLSIVSVARKVGIAVIVIFLLVAGIIISNTIRLTVFARRREISIMQLVGATNMYIRMPFICEGLLSGILGALVAVLLLAAARSALSHQLALTTIGMLQGSLDHVDVVALILELIAVGGAVGVIASWIAVGRYLRT